MSWPTAQHLHILDWLIQPKSCSKSGTGTINVYSWYMTTAKRTEQSSEKQKSFMEQDNTARSCLTNRAWHVVITVGDVPCASEFSHHLGELWERQEEDWWMLHGGVLHKRAFDILSKPSEQRTQSKGRQRGVKGKRGCVGDKERGPVSAWKRSLNPRNSAWLCVWEAMRPFTAPCTSMKTTMLQSFELPP